MINWIEKWLIDRRQRVVVDGEVSNWKVVLSGVPQGSVLGPILFLIYINDLDDDITSKVLKFADDTKVFRKIKSDADRQHLQDDLNKLIEWSEKWQMLFNFGKCKCLHTGHRRTRGHGVTLAKKLCRLDIRKFSQRTVNEWNRLSAHCVGASSVNIFKNKIDIYLRRAGYT